jgi:hypothetical protein
MRFGQVGDSAWQYYALRSQIESDADRNSQTWLFDQHTTPGPIAIIAPEFNTICLTSASLSRDTCGFTSSLSFAAILTSKMIAEASPRLSHRTLHDLTGRHLKVRPRPTVKGSVPLFIVVDHEPGFLGERTIHN